MSGMSRLAAGLCLLPLLLAAAFAAAQPRASEEGVHYQVIEPAVPTAVGPDRIEVTEVFWYGCPQCQRLEPLMTEWGEGVTGDLVFQRMPAIWNDVMETHARIYYAAEAADALGRIHRAAFRAIHEEGNPLRSEAEARALFERNGVRPDDFERHWNAPEVAAALEDARMRTAAYGVEKVPSVVIDGRYRVVQNAAVPDHQELNIAVNMVIKQIRDVRRGVQ